MNPGVIFGPVGLPQHAQTSPGMVLQMLQGNGTFDLFTFFADVDDVTALVCSLLVDPKAQGRCVCVCVQAPSKTRFRWHCATELCVGTRALLWLPCVCGYAEYEHRITYTVPIVPHVQV